MSEGCDLLTLHDENPITLGPSETAPDVTVLINPQEARWRKILSDAYPRATWIAHPLKQNSNDASPSLLEVDIPGPVWSRKPHGPFRAVKTGGTWRRKTYDFGYGFANGVLKADEKVVSWNEGASADWQSRSFFVTGPFAAPQEGDYRFSVASSCKIRLTVAGRKVFDGGPSLQPWTASRTLHLKAGAAPVEMKVYLFGTQELPAVKVEGPGLSPGARLGG